MLRKVLVKDNNKEVEGWLHYFGQVGDVNDGIGIVAIIELDNGEIKEFDAHGIKFLDKLDVNEINESKELVFEELNTNRGTIYRAKVFGGWLVASENDVVHDVDGRMASGWDWRDSLTFIPDSNHEWKVKVK